MFKHFRDEQIGALACDICQLLARLGDAALLCDHFSQVTYIFIFHKGIPTHPLFLRLPALGSSLHRLILFIVLTYLPYYLATLLLFYPFTSILPLLSNLSLYL